MDTIIIPSAVLTSIVEHAKRDAPNECCGLLVGSAQAIDQAVETRNARSSPTRYLVDPEDHFALIRTLRGTSREIVGAYHSHPASPARPSPTDLAEAWSDDFVYVIVSLSDAQNPVVRAYRIMDRQPRTMAISSG